MYKKISIIMLLSGLSILEYKPLLSLAPSSQVNDMFQTHSYSAPINPVTRKRKAVTDDYVEFVPNKSAKFFEHDPHALALSTECNPYLQLFEKRLEYYYLYALNCIPLPVLDIFFKKFYSLIEDSFPVNLDISLFTSIADQAIIPLMVDFLKKTNQEVYQTFLDLAPLCWNTTNKIFLIEDFVDQLIFLIQLPNPPIATNALIDLLTDCFYLLKKNSSSLDNADLISYKITTLWQQRQFVVYAIISLINNRPSDIPLPIKFIVNQLAKNPQQLLAYDALKEPFRTIIRELNSTSINTHTDATLNIYEQLVILTQENSSWRDILREEAKNLESSRLRIYSQIQDLYKRYSVKATTTQETITLTTLVQALKDNNSDCLAIINNPTNALKVITLIQNLSLSHLECPIFSQLDYKHLYTSIVQSLTQTPSTLKALLDIIDSSIAIPALPSKQNFLKQQKIKPSPNDPSNLIIIDPYQIKQKTLDLINHFVSCRRETELQTIWLEWLYSHQHWEPAKQKLIQSIFRWSTDQPIRDKYYDLFETWWTNTPSNDRDRILDIEHIELLQGEKNISRQDIKEICLFWKLRMQQLVTIFLRLKDKNIQFSLLSNDFINLWCDKITQWITVVALDDSQEDFLYLSLYAHIQILQTFQMFYQYINQTDLIKGNKTILSKLLNTIKKRIENVLQKNIQKQKQASFNLRRVTQSLSEIGKAMQIYSKSINQLSFFKTSIVTSNKFKSLQEQYKLSIKIWIRNQNNTSLDQKYHQWKSTVAETTLQQQDFATYQEIEEQFKQSKEKKQQNQQYSQMSQLMQEQRKQNIKQKQQEQNLYKLRQKQGIQDTIQEQQEQHISELRQKQGIQDTIQEQQKQQEQNLYKLRQKQGIQDTIQEQQEQHISELRQKQGHTRNTNTSSNKNNKNNTYHELRQKTRTSTRYNTRAYKNNIYPKLRQKQLQELQKHVHNVSSQRQLQKATLTLSTRNTTLVQAQKEIQKQLQEETLKQVQETQKQLQETQKQLQETQKQLQELQEYVHTVSSQKQLQELQEYVHTVSSQKQLQEETGIQVHTVSSQKQLQELQEYVHTVSSQKQQASKQDPWINILEQDPVFNAILDTEQDPLTKEQEAQKKIETVEEEQARILTLGQTLQQNAEQIQRQALIEKALQNIRENYPTIPFVITDTIPLNMQTTTFFIYKNDNFYINYNFLVLLASQYPIDMLSILDYLVYEHFYFNYHVSSYDQNLEQSTLQYLATLACNRPLELTPSLSLLAKMHQQWFDQITLPGSSFTQEQLLFLEKKIILYQGLAFHLENTPTDPSNPINSDITTEPRLLSSTDRREINQIITSILSANTMA